MFVVFSNDLSTCVCEYLAVNKITLFAWVHTLHEGSLQKINTQTPAAKTSEMLTTIINIILIMVCKNVPISRFTIAEKKCHIACLTKLRKSAMFSVFHSNFFMLTSKGVWKCIYSFEKVVLFIYLVLKLNLDIYFSWNNYQAFQIIYILCLILIKLRCRSWAH